MYRTARTPVAGCGLLAVRDVVSHLRADGIDHAFGYGVSQSGRPLRQLLWEGFNVDEAGATVFDGVFSHIASSRRGEFNHRYAQPALTHVLGLSNLPPFDHAGLLARQCQLGGVPRRIFTNSAWEYWRGDGALLHVDPTTGEDLPEDPDVRTYLIARTDHLGPVPLKDVMPGANPVHDLDVMPVLQALLVALERWVRDGSEPRPAGYRGRATARPSRGRGCSPASAMPPGGSGGAPAYAPHRPGTGRRPRHRPLADPARRAVRLPGVGGRRRRQRGRRDPPPRRRRAGCGLHRLEPEATGLWPARRALRVPRQRGPVPAGAAVGHRRYPTREDYAAAARDAAERLVAERFLLPGDVNAAVEAAAAGYE